MITLVQLNPDERFVLRDILDIMACIVREDGRVAGREVKGARQSIAVEDGRTRVAFGKIEPFVGLLIEVSQGIWMRKALLWVANLHSDANATLAIHAVGL